ncbi:hypothetical protein GLDPPO_GLDPPO_11710, partial [Dysosmobacter welbionis]
SVMPTSWILPYKGGMSKWQEKAESKLQSKSRLSNLSLPRSSQQPSMPVFP